MINYKLAIILFGVIWLEAIYFYLFPIIFKFLIGDKYGKKRTH